MNWSIIIGLAIAAFLMAVFVLRLPKRGWMLFAATLLFGLAGYATQGDPALPAAEKPANAQAARSGAEMVEARQSLFDPAQPKPAYLTVSDGFARKGRFDQAAQLLRKGLGENPNDGEGWLALANALVEHANGQVTPPATYAFAKAEAALPGHPGPADFLGFSLLRSGKPMETRAVWQALLDSTPQDAPYREDLSLRLERLDQMIGMMQAQSVPAGE